MMLGDEALVARGRAGRVLEVGRIAACGATGAGASRGPPRSGGGAPPLKLDVKIDGVPATWQQDVFDRVPHFASANKEGEARDTWSLRELAHTTVGPDRARRRGDRRQAQGDRSRRVGRCGAARQSCIARAAAG